MRRRVVCLLAIFALAVTTTLPAQDAKKPGFFNIERTRFVQTPRFGVWLRAEAFYTRAKGLELLSLDAETTTSDKDDIARFRLSTDNGKTWTPFKTMTTATKTPKGTFRRWFSPAFVDPHKDVMLFLDTQGVLPTDSIIPESMMYLGLHHALSRDGGRTWYHEGHIVQKGAGFSPQHPFPGVHVGKNSIMIGTTACFPIKLRSGEILIPIQVCPAGPDGKYKNVGGGYTYHDSAVVIGRWNADDRLDWHLSDLVKAEPEKTTRGYFEPTLAEFDGSRVLMVMRGSNDHRPHLPGHRWYSLSRDAGQTWSKPAIWTFTDGTKFFSPSSCSQLLPHSNGRTYWIGNICSANSNSNEPRHPLVIAEVDPQTLLLRKETVTTIDKRHAKDPALLQLSNFFVREDRDTKQILVHLSPLGRSDEPVNKNGQAKVDRTVGLDWTGSAYLYRISIVAK